MSTTRKAPRIFYMDKKALLALLVLFVLCTTAWAGEANEVLEQNAEGLRKVVKGINAKSSDPYSDPESFFILEGCYGGKKGEEFSNQNVKITALYYSEIFKKNTSQVTRVHFKFNKPLSLSAAQNYVADFAPFLRGRNFTQQHKMTSSEATDCTPQNGGMENRYTRDYFVEFYYAPGGKLIQEARLWNANYNN